MKTMLVVAHGSRRDRSNDEVRELTVQLGGQADGFDRVDCAFLELAAPSIPEGLRRHISAGADEIVVVPYFLSAGRHVVSDIPADIASVQVEHPSVRITLAPYLGSAEGIAGLLLAQATTTKG